MQGSMLTSARCGKVDGLLRFKRRSGIIEEILLESEQEQKQQQSTLAFPKKVKRHRKSKHVEMQP